MKWGDIKLGMKVVPHAKTAQLRPLGLNRSFVWHIAKRKDQPFLYIAAFNPKTVHREVILSYDPTESRGDYFAPEDFNPYRE